MKRQSKCEACMKIAQEEHRMRRLSKGYMYKLLRENCTHTEEQRKGEVAK